MGGPHHTHPRSPSILRLPPCRDNSKPTFTKTISVFPSAAGGEAGRAESRTHAIYKRVNGEQRRVTGPAREKHLRFQLGV